MKKRIISLLLALVMIVGMLPGNPIHVHATEQKEENVVEETTIPTTQPQEEETLAKTKATKGTAAAANTYDVYVNGVGMADGTYLASYATVTRPDKPKVGYAYYKDGVLTLNYYNCRGAGYKYDSAGLYALIYADQDLKIVLKGENTLNQTMTDGDGNYFRLDGEVSGGIST